MSFVGADTEQLRAHSGMMRTGGARLGEVSESLVRATADVRWQGPDADEFRGRCVSVLPSLRRLTEEIARHADVVMANADEQDQASEPDAADGREGDGVPQAQPFSGGQRRGGPVELPPEEDPGYLRPPVWDSMKYTPDKGDAKTEVTVKDAAGNSVTIPLDAMGDAIVDPSTLHLTDHDRTVTVTTESGPVTLEASEKAKIHVDPDGSVTYTSLLTTKGTLSASGQLEYLHAKGSAGVGTETAWSVKVPPGTDPATALAANPFDPASIPPGATITTSDSITRTASGELGAGTDNGGINIGASESTTDKQATSISRDDHGRLTVTTGPETLVDRSLKINGNIGPVEAEASATHSSTSSKTETTVYDASAAGNQAYLDNGLNRHPATGHEAGVLDRYTDSYGSEADKIAAKAGIKDGPSLSYSQTTHTDERVVRTDPDGNVDYFRRVLPDGPGSPNSVTVVGHGDMTHGVQPTYQVTAVDSDGSAAESLGGYRGEPIPRADNGTITMQYSYDEVEQIAKTAEARQLGVEPSQVSDPNITRTLEDMSRDPNSFGRADVHENVEYRDCGGGRREPVVNTDIHSHRHLGRPVSGPTGR